MILSVKLHTTYVLGMSCGCTKSTQGGCGINYRIG